MLFEAVDCCGCAVDGCWLRSGMEMVFIFFLGHVSSVKTASSVAPFILAFNQLMYYSTSALINENHEDKRETRRWAQCIEWMH